MNKDRFVFYLKLSELISYDAFGSTLQDLAWENFGNCEMCLIKLYF
jgi:hypothetical protein